MGDRDRIDLKGRHKETALCAVCGKEVKYRLQTGLDAAEYNGVPLLYNTIVAVCPVCGKEVFVPWVAEHNVAKEAQMIELERRKQAALGRKGKDA